MTAPARVVSLLASATEIVAALGCADRLVAISHECDHPAEILDRPRVTTPTFDVAAPSYAIDETVKRLVQEGLSLYRVDGPALRALSPDLIVTQTQCAVCAVTPDDLLAATADWLGADVPVVSLSPERL